MPYTEEIQPGSVFKTDVTDTASNDEYLGSCSPWMVKDGDGDRRKQTGNVVRRVVCILEVLYVLLADRYPVEEFSNRVAETRKVEGQVSGV